MIGWVTSLFFSFYFFKASVLCTCMYIYMYTCVLHGHFEWILLKSINNQVSHFHCFYIHVYTWCNNAYMYTYMIVRTCMWYVILHVLCTFTHHAVHVTVVCGYHRSENTWRQSLRNCYWKEQHESPQRCVCMCIAVSLCMALFLMCIIMYMYVHFISCRSSNIFLGRRGCDFLYL